jgi:hypothetical protein
MDGGAPGYNLHGGAPGRRRLLGQIVAGPCLGAVASVWRWTGKEHADSGAAASSGMVTGVAWSGTGAWQRRRPRTGPAWGGTGRRGPTVRNAGNSSVHLSDQRDKKVWGKVRCGGEGESTTVLCICHEYATCIIWGPKATIYSIGANMQESL